MAEQGDIIRITIIIELPANTIANLVWYARQVNATETDDATVATEMAVKVGDDFEAELESIISTQCSWTRLDYAVYDDVLEQWNTVQQVPIVSATGTSLASFEAHNIAGLVKFFTNVGRRQGKKYIPAIVSTWLAFSEFSATATTALLAWGVAHLANNVYDGSTFTLGVWSETLEFKGFSGTVEVNDQNSHQDRRMPGVGI